MNKILSENNKKEILGLIQEYKNSLEELKKIDNKWLDVQARLQESIKFLEDELLK